MTCGDVNGSRLLTLGSVFNTTDCIIYNSTIEEVPYVQINYCGKYCVFQYYKCGVVIVARSLLLLRHHV
jgi:hypothetical protein